MKRFINIGSPAVLMLLAAVAGPGHTDASSENSITKPDAGANYTYSSLALDTSGNPVASYFKPMGATAGELRVLHCNDANCVGADESIAIPDGPEGEVGFYNSLALDGSGNPVISYRGNNTLKVLHCNDPNCAGAGESVTFPNGGGAAFWTSLKLDASGNPVISFEEQGNDDLKVLHCNDPNCAGGDESITAPDTTGEVGRFASLELDTFWNPVVTYYDITNSDLKVLHCNDPNCAGGDESITAPDTTGAVGLHTSLELDTSGNPVIAYLDATNADLKVLHCNDPNCAGGDESITAPDSAVISAEYISLALDGSGNPVISYRGNNTLKVLHCNDPNCVGGDESITAPDPTSGGTYASLALDGAGSPVVSYTGSLKILHCGDADCSGVKPVGGIAELPEVAGTPLEAGGSSRPSVGVLAGIAAAVTVGAVVLGGAAWVAKRRWLR